MLFINALYKLKQVLSTLFLRYLGRPRLELSIKTTL